MPVVASTQYAAANDLANLGLIGGVLASINTTIQNAALVAASGVADSSLQSRYTLPLTSWGQDLVRCVCIIAAYDLLTSKGYNPATGADPNIRERYLDQLAWLKSVAAGGNTPSYIADSAAGSVDGEDEVDTSTHGGIQISTSSVRGWTPRGTSNGSDFDDFNNPGGG